MLHAGSGSEFSYNDYNYDNTNSNVSAHIASKKLISTDLASWQKITNNLKGVGNHQVNTTYKAKANEKIEISQVLNIEIIVKQFKIGPSKFPEKSNGKRLDISINHEGRDRVLWTSSVILQELILMVNKDDFPFKTTILKENKGYKFT